MKIIMWEYKTFEMSQNLTMKGAIEALNTLGSEGWELVAIREVNTIRMESNVKRTFFILKRPSGQIDATIK